jgi:hypothetical protein
MPDSQAMLAAGVRRALLLETTLEVSPAPPAR